VFGISRLATLLLFVSSISAYLELALALAMSGMAVAMLISFASTSIVSFAVAITLFGLAISIFYPVSFTLVTRNTLSGYLGSKLGVYNSLFGVG
jgi:hypothetical protein